MATDTFSSYGNHILVYLNKAMPDAIIEKVTNGTDIKPGMIVTAVGETSPDIDTCAAGEEPLGVVLRNPDHDIDTAYADGITVKVARIGSGCKVRVWIKANSASFVQGQPLAVNQTTATMASLWAYTDNAEATDTLNFKIGLAAETHTQDASDDKIIMVWLL
jgi:hypothetical protein